MFRQKLRDYTLELKNEIIELFYYPKETNLTLICQLYISLRTRLAFALRCLLSLLLLSEKQISRYRVCRKFPISAELCIQCAIFRLSSFYIRKKTRDLAPPIHIISKTNDCTFLENLSREALCPARSHK